MIVDYRTPHEMVSSNGPPIRVKPTEILRLRAFGEELGLSTAVSMKTILRTAVMIGLGWPGAKLGVTTAPWLWVVKAFPRRYDLDFLKSLMMVAGTADHVMFRTDGCLLYDVMLEERLGLHGRQKLMAAMTPNPSGRWSLRLLELIEYNLWRYIQTLKSLTWYAAHRVRPRRLVGAA